MAVIFVKTRHHYASYVDFWRLVDASEFETRFIDEIDLADETAIYVFTPMNGEILPCLRVERRSRVVWWNLERPGADPTTGPSIDALSGLIDAIWVSDRFAAQSDSRFTYAFMASHARIADANFFPQKYDVCHLAYIWGRREACINELRARGLSIAPQAYGADAQNKIVPACKLMLNLHQFADAPMVAPLRFAVAAAYGIPIISERLPVPENGPMIIGEIERIPDLVRRLVADSVGTESLSKHGYYLHRQFCINTDFRNEVERRIFEWQWR